MLKILLASLCFVLPLSAEVYELRTYTPQPDKMESLLKRFREHTTAIFENHGMKNIGYWTTEKGDLIYLVTHKNKETAKKNWKSFSADPAWQKAYKESVQDGKLVKKITTQFLTPTDFSKLK